MMGNICFCSFLFTAHCITNTTVGLSILFIWISSVFWSTAPLVGWGSYTGQYDTFVHITLSGFLDVCKSLHTYTCSSKLLLVFFYFSFPSSAFFSLIAVCLWFLIHIFSMIILIIIPLSWACYKWYVNNAWLLPFLWAFNKLIGSV